MKFGDKALRLLRVCVILIALLNTITANALPQNNQRSNEFPSCSQIAAEKRANMLEADVVAIDHPIVFNRLGAQNVNWMMYALRHDVVDISNPKNLKTLDYSDEGNERFEKIKLKHVSRDIALRSDLRPRPLVLRVAAGDYLKVRFTNLLKYKLRSYGDAPPNYANPFDYPDPLNGIDHPMEHSPQNTLLDLETGKPLTPEQKKDIYTVDDQVASRVVGFHPQGLELVISMDDDSSYVGKNKLINKNRFIALNKGLYNKYEDRKFESASLAQPGETLEYCFYAPEEGAYLISSDGAVFEGEGTAGNSGVGLFGAVTVQPSSEKYKNGIDKTLSTRFYRAQVTEEELRLATRKDENGDLKRTPTGQPVINYEAIYPNNCSDEQKKVWCDEGKAGKPILNMVWGNRIWHGDINAIIVGTNEDGSFTEDAYPLERIGARNPTLPNRLEPFREFVSIFHDENAATQAFPYFFEHPELKHTLHGVRDSFMINYGSGGVGAEIIANRLKVGPMQDCIDCAYEEFFLSSFVVGDAAMLVDKPANLITSQCQPEFLPQLIDDSTDSTGKRKKKIWLEKERIDKKIVTFEGDYKKFCEPEEREVATKAYYPHDPANVHHSYIGDFVKFRNMHSGKEQHIFHLHNHQWLFNPNDDNSNYIDAQGIGPGSGYTYEIAFGGSGNRNKTVGDAIFHCHFYPHFAQGMWYMWRNHDVFEAGTPLAVSQTNSGYHQKPFELASGKPAINARALPDGEISAGVPIPAIVPLPGKGMAPMPEKVQVVEKENKLGSKAILARPFSTEIKNPGYPFWVAGVTEHGQYHSSVGSRPTTPPLDMCNESNCKEIFQDSQIKAKIRGAEGHDGGLPRHALAGYSAGSKDESELTRFSAKRDLKKAKPIYYHEEGTDLEKIAMNFHAEPRPGHPTYATDKEGNLTATFFATNGADPVPGAPFNEPCIDDKGVFLVTGSSDVQFFAGKYAQFMTIDTRLLPSGIEFGGDNPRIYKGANIQLDVVFNKLGYHYPQQRILALWEDVGKLLDKTQPPEPLVMRLNTFDCAMYAHTNLVPKEFYADDYQITTPTDVIGQHIHLPKWDLTSADGGANGWNYEDGTFSPDTVLERIHAINKWNALQKTGEKVLPLDKRKQILTKEEIEKFELLPKVHPYFNGKNISEHQDASRICEDNWEKALKQAKEEVRKQGICESEENKKIYASTEECVIDKEEGFLSFKIEHGMPGACNWLGARTTLQRWFSDPIVNRYGKHRGLGTTFTHDHLGPSTHQQLGLYATMLSEPPGSEWWNNELDSKTGKKIKLYDITQRNDGGPTSWQAVITGKNGKCIDIDGDNSYGDCEKQGDDSHREFFLQFGDFQHAYVKGAFYGVSERGIGWPFEKEEDIKKTGNSRRKIAQPTPDSFRLAINPSVRKPAKPGFPDILAFEPTCPGGKELVNKPPEEGGPLPGSVYRENDFSNPELYNARGEPLRPCPEAISADDIGMMVVNYRNEPLGVRVYDPDKFGRDGKRGTQADGQRGDLAFAMQTRTDRAIAALNTVLGDTPYLPLTLGAHAGDPFTPLMRAHSGDRIKIKIQGGSHEHEHNASINGLSWLQGGSGFGQAPHSGWRNSQNTGLSEQFTFSASLVDYESPFGINDRMYTIDSSQDGMWNGVWGILRSYNRAPVQAKLMPLADRSLPVLLAPGDSSKYGGSIDNSCPVDAPIRTYKISAVLANQVLHNRLGITIPEWKSRSYRWWEWEWWQFQNRSHLDLNGGTLIYNPRQTTISIQITNDDGAVVDTRSFNTGPLHDPTAILFVRDEDLNLAGRISLKSDAPLEPLVLRAAAGECIHVKLTNRLPVDFNKMPDLDGYTSVSGIIPRSCPELGRTKGNNDKAQCERQEYFGRSMTTFNNNLLRPSNYVGLHPQMAHYDVQSADGNNVGFNAVNTVKPGETRSYAWFAGKVKVPSNVCYVDEESEKEAYEIINYFGSLSLAAPLNAFFSETSFNVNRTKENLKQYKAKKLRELKEGRDFSVKISTLSDNEEIVKKFGEKPSNPRINPLFNPNSLDESAMNRLIESEYSEWRAIEDNWIRDFSYFVSKIFSSKDLFDADLEKNSNLERDVFDRGWILREIKKYANLETLWPITPYTTRLISMKPRENCEPAKFVALETGGSNLTPPDRIKQGQKGAIGALVVGPELSQDKKKQVKKALEKGEDDKLWQEADTVLDRQDIGKSRKTRTIADVSYTVMNGSGKEVTRRYRDLVLVHQKGLNLRYKNGTAVPNIAAEKEMANEDPTQTTPEDAHDSGHMAINYGTEPMWFRFGLPPDAPFGKSGFGGGDSAWQAFSDECCSNGNGIGTVISADQPVGEPYVPIMKAYAGEEMRIRVLMPTGTGRGSVVEFHGHSWMRDPYLAEFVEPEGYPRGGGLITWGTPSKCIGKNALAMHLGGQESLTPMAHFDLVFPRAGGKYGVTGDYLWRDHAGFGITNGLWAIIRVEDAPKEYTDLHKDELFAPESLRTNCNFVVTSSNTTAP